jgi:type IV secretory pathway VirB2 component (pilin)
MVWYVAVVAVLNLGLGYMFARYMGWDRGQAACSADELLDAEGA